MSNKEQSTDELLKELGNLRATVSKLEKQLSDEKSRHKKSEEALKKSEHQARAIIDAATDILCLLDKYGNIIDCNQTFASYLNLKPEELEGISVFDFVPEKEIYSQKQLLNKIFNDGNPLTGETKISGKSYDYSVFPILCENGEVESIAIYASDITEQKASRQALIESEEIFSNFMLNSPIYVFFKDKEIRPVRLSKNYEKMLGMPLENILGKTMNELFPSALARQMVDDDLKVLKEGKTIKIEEELNGRHYSTIKFPVFIDGEAKYLAGYTMDITEQIKSENSIRESEERFRKVYAEGTMPISMLNRDFHFISANQVFQETFGYSEAELKSMTFKELTHPDHLEADLENINLLIQRKTDVYRTEKRYITKSNQVVWGNAQVSIVRDKRENFLYFLVMINNITSYKNAEAEIRTKNEQLLKLNAEKDKFFSIIAHDLRSPFNTFLGFTEMMAEELYSMTLDEIQKIATDMRNSAFNLYRLLENLLEWSMIQRGVTPFNPIQLNLADLVRENLKTSLEPIRRKSIKLNMHIPESVSLIADPNMIGTVIRNLLSNAIKFTPRNGTVTISATKTETGTVEFTFSDTGIGMSEEMVSSLFNLDSHNNRPGTEGELSTGLGLLLCKEFIEKHGGNISVKSEPGQGSSFIITFNG